MRSFLYLFTLISLLIFIVIGLEETGSWKFYASLLAVTGFFFLVIFDWKKKKSKGVA